MIAFTFAAMSDMLIVFWFNECKEKNILPSLQHNLRIFNNSENYIIDFVISANSVRVPV
jgi:hypothetical protein